MQVHGPRDVIDANEIRSRLNGNFAVVEIGHVDLFIYTPEEADALIKAAVEAKRLLSPPVITDSERDCPESHPGSGAPCYRSGDHGVHRDTDGETWRTANPPRETHSWAPCGAGEGDFICNSQAGHDGPEHVAWGGHDHVCHRWPVAAPETPVPWTPRCSGCNGYCGTCEAAVAQQRETAGAVPQCDSGLPLRHGAEILCTDDEGHDGDHTALNGKYRWVGAGADARQLVIVPVITGSARTCPAVSDRGTPCTLDAGHPMGQGMGHEDASGELWYNAAPVIDSDRTCDQANPESGAWCHKNGEHQTHRDGNGDEWRTEPGIDMDAIIDAGGHIYDDAEEAASR